MLVKSVAGLITVRRRTVAIRFGRTMGEPLFGGAAFGLVAVGALARGPQIDDLSHFESSTVPNATWSP
jgi:hypothetical protein